MNDQFNNYNSQFNNQPPVSNGGSPAQKPKRKFFTSSLVDDVNVDTVGGTTSGNVVSWSAGGPSSNSISNNQNTFFEQGNMTGASGPGLGAFDQFGNNQMNQSMTATMEMPMLNQGPVNPWPQPVPEMSQQPMMQQAMLQQPMMNQQPMMQQAMPSMTQEISPAPVIPQQVQTNAAGMALAQPVQQTEQVQQPMPQPKIETSEAIEMLNEVNGDVYIDDEPEVLEFDDNTPKAQVDNSSSGLAEKYQEQQKFQEDQLSQGNFASLMGNSGGSTFAPGMTKKESVAAPTPQQGVQQPVPQQPVQQPILNSMPKPDLGIVPVAPVIPEANLAATPIFAAATEVLDENPIQGQPAINPQLQNQHVESWMGSQPLSGNNFKEDKNVDTNSYSGVAEKEKPAEKKKLSKKLRNKKTEPVPEEVTKKDGGKIRVDNMASAIVGSKYTSFVMSPFNFAALFFGPTYMAYRRMPLAAIIVYLIQMGVVFFAPTFAPDEYFSFAQFGAIIGFALLFALSVNRMIIANAKFKAKSIVKKYGEDGPKDEAIIMAQRMGRPSIVMALLFMILSTVISGLLLTTVLKDSRLANLYNIFMNAYQNGGSVEFKGYINHSDYDVSKVVSLDVPDGFTNVEKMKYTYITEGSGMYNDCTFEIYAVDKFISGDTFIKKLAEFNKASDKVTNKEINGIEWTNYYTDDGMYKIFYRGFTYKNHAIVFEYKSGKQASEGVCDSLYVNVMDSIRIKES